jgi:dipeptidase E
MLLTSNGLRNDALTEALAELLGMRFGAARLVVIPSATLATGGDHGWLVEDLSRLHGLGWKQLNVLEPTSIPRRHMLDRVRHADVIYAEGGNHYHLANGVIDSGLAAELGKLLDEKVYVGLSAGSMIFSRNMSLRTGEAFAEHGDLDFLEDKRVQARPALGLFDWYLKPHMNSRSFPERVPAWYEKAAAQLDFPVYALDDNSAVRVRDDEVDVVSAGDWLLLNPEPPQATPGAKRRWPLGRR